ncbi:unnamed protein product [Leuciscus chuanchicus]
MFVRIEADSSAVQQALGRDLRRALRLQRSFLHHAVERERSEAGSARVPADTLAAARPTQQTIKHTALLAQVAGAVEPGEAATQRVVVSHSLEQ